MPEGLHVRTKTRNGIVALLSSSLAGTDINVSIDKAFPFRPEELPVAAVGVTDSKVVTDRSASNRRTQERLMDVTITVLRLCQAGEDGDALVDAMLVHIERALSPEVLRALGLKDLRLVAEERLPVEAFAAQRSDASQLLFGVKQTLSASVLTAQGEPTVSLIGGF